MPDKRMLIVSAEVVEKINANRGDMGPGEFINFLIDSHLKRETDEERFVGREDLQEFEQSMRDLLRGFLEFFISYGMELGQHPGKDDLEALSQRLQGLSGSLGKKSRS